MGTGCVLISLNISCKFKLMNIGWILFHFQIHFVNFSRFCKVYRECSRSVRLCIYIYIYTWACVNVFGCVNMHEHVCAYIHVCMYVCMHTSACACVQVHEHAHTCASGLVRTLDNQISRQYLKIDTIFSESQLKKGMFFSRQTSRKEHNFPDDRNH